MKISNILLTGLFGSITFTTLAMMVDIVFGIGSPDYTQYDQKTIPLPAFRYLQLSNAARSVAIEASDTASIKLFTMSGNPMPSLDYHLEGDTLIVDQVGNHDVVGAYFKLQVPGNVLQGVTAQNVQVVLNDYPFRRMSLVLNNARVQFYPKVRRNLGMLSVTGVNESHINVSSSIDTLSLQLEKSSIVVDDAIQLVQGRITNSSTLSVRAVGVFDFSKDASSHFDHWN